MPPPAVGKSMMFRLQASGRAGPATFLTEHKAARV